MVFDGGDFDGDSIEVKDVGVAGFGAISEVTGRPLGVDGGAVVVHIDEAFFGFFGEFGDEINGLLFHIGAQHFAVADDVLLEGVVNEGVVRVAVVFGKANNVVVEEVGDIDSVWGGDKLNDENGGNDGEEATEDEKKFFHVRRAGRRLLRFRR